MARTRRRQAQVPAQRLILDSGAVIAWSRGDVHARALLTRALELALDVRIPIAVLAETLRGGPRDAPIHRVRNGGGRVRQHRHLLVEGFDERYAKSFVLAGA